MADVNKSVEITLSANIKQLQKNLEQIPGMTKKEASAMVRALSSEFNKAQKAAKKAANESKNAAKASAKAFEQSSEKIGHSFKAAADEAATAAKEIKVSLKKQQKRQTCSRKVRKQSRRLSGLRLLPWTNSLRVCPRRRRMLLRWLMDWRQQQSRQSKEDLRQWLLLLQSLPGLLRTSYIPSPHEWQQNNRKDSRRLKS